MLSNRQLEAFVWAVRLKTLSRAAARLNMAQPTISKRIQELESSCGFEVFYKQGRSVALTEQGAALYEIAQQILDLVEKAEAISEVQSPRRQRVAIGVTELVAYTWLPALVDAVRKRHLTADIQVLIEQSSTLLNKLRAGDFDIIVSSSYLSEIQLVDISASDVPLALLASPALCLADRPFSGEELSDLSLISHGLQTGSIKALASWMRDLAWTPKEIIELDSIAAQVGLAAAGMGVALMPRKCFASLISAGKLVEVQTLKPPPVLNYRIVFREHDANGLVEQIAYTMQEVADFSKIYHDGES